MKNRGQAAVEFILLIAVLTPILVFVLSSIKEGVFDKMGAWLEHEIACQVRYGYSCNDFPNIDRGSLARTKCAKGQTPIPYEEVAKHPLVWVDDGWAP